MKRLFIVCRCGLLVLSTLVLSGCGGEQKPEATSANELEQFLTDNPDIVEEARLEEEKEDAISSKPIDIGDEL